MITDQSLHAGGGPKPLVENQTSVLFYGFPNLLGYTKWMISHLHLKGLYLLSHHNPIWWFINY